ncbi:MAG TPA: hypothetical protein VG844_16945 [Terracidiphilus sp.]|nr:hypothetical protein [Terracidiphilus sp.]
MGSSSGIRSPYLTAFVDRDASMRYEEEAVDGGAAGFDAVSVDAGLAAGSEAAGLASEVGLSAAPDDELSEEEEPLLE